MTPAAGAGRGAERLARIETNSESTLNEIREIKDHLDKLCDRAETNATGLALAAQNISTLFTRIDKHDAALDKLGLWSGVNSLWALTLSIAAGWLGLK